ncbi:MAG: hypothetical protein JWN70_402, partial [Planctomycetaceae bacterium]|nr:hypothetical protein [Planctomycetaceae bacterium]
KCGSVLKLRDSSLLGKTGKCPKCEHRFVLRDPDEVEMELVEAPAPRSQRASSGPKVGTGAQWVPDHGQEPEPVPTFGSPETDALNRLKRKRRKRSMPQTIAMVAGFVILGVGGIWGWKTFSPALAKLEPAAGKKVKHHKAAPVEHESEPSETDAVAATDKPVHGEFGRPTKGQPIDLLWIPSGARIVISMRPAAIWKAGALGEGEFVAGLGPLGAWMATTMEQFLMAKPSEIEEALICLIPGARGTPPDVAAVVHRTAASKFKKSEMIDKFGGQAVETGPMKYYANEKWAMVLRPDMQTYAISPVAMAAEMLDASESPKPTDGGIEELLLKTDRDLDFTVACIPADLKIHGEFLVPPNAQPFLQNVADWISSDDEAEAVAWSFHLSDQKFYTQLLARNSAVTKAHQLAKSFKSRLAATPRRILETIELMNPPQAGPRKVIGRVPAMSKVVQLGTHIETGNRLVSLSFHDSERAGPNLGLGTLLAWDESTRTNFSASPGGPVMANAAEKKPLKELLRTKIDVDFRRAPLQDAFSYIAGEAKFELIIDGDALKSAGYTKNMPQTFKDDGITASAALGKIVTVGKYDKMCFVIDEAKSTVTVMTLQKAADAKLTVYAMK